MMNEDLLQLIWQEQLFNAQELKTYDDLSLSIISPGKLNIHAGPDFFNGRIKLDGIELVGNIEIHINSSNWNDHLHQFDPQYNNVILHVVLNHNKDVKSLKGASIKTLELKTLINLQINDESKLLFQNRNLCASFLKSQDKIKTISFLDRLAFERIQRKKEDLIELKKSNSLSWEETFMYSLFTSFGLPANKEPLGRLSLQIPFKILLKSRRDPLNIEALLFGMSGLLPMKTNGIYERELQNRFHFLSHKYKFEVSLKAFNWKYSRMRYNNFPVIRIAQLAGLLVCKSNGILNWLENPTFENITTFMNAPINEYWLYHYDFGKKRNQKSTYLTKDFCKRLYINSFIPFMLAYNSSKYLDLVESEMMSLSSESNKVIKSWKTSGVEINNAWDSQAILELNNSYCEMKKCLTCTVGKSILKE